ILFGAILAIIPIIPEVPAEVPIVPADPLVAPEDSLPPAPELPLVSPFLCSNDSEADSESDLAEQRPERHESLAVHDVMVSRWRDRVTSRPSSPSGSSSHDTFAPSSKFLVAPVIAPPRIRQRPAILIRPGKAITFGRPYHTYRNVPHSSSFGSSSDSSSDTSSDSPLDSLPDTSSAFFRVRCISRWRSAPLSTPYTLTTSESSPDSSSERSLDSPSFSVGPSRKRCRSPTTSVPSSTPISRSIAPTHVDLLPPRKRFRDSYSPEDSREEHIKIGTADGEVVTDLGIGDGVGAHTEDGIGIGVEISTSDIREDEEEFEVEASAGGMMEIVVNPLVTGGISESTRGDVPDLEGTLYDIVHYMSEVPLDRITEFETAQRQLEAGQLMASEERAGLADRVRRLGHEKLRIHKDHDDARKRLRRLESLVERRLGFRPYPSEWNKGNDNPNSEYGRGAMPVARVCTYQDFVKCQPLNFKGTEGVVGLTRWFEKMETVFNINNCLEVYQVKTIGVDAAFTMTWRDLIKLMTEVYCLMNEIQKMETELWNLTVNNNELAAYTQLTLLCTRMVPGEEDQIERYVGGPPNNIQGNVMSAEPTRLQDAIRLANSLMDQKLKGYAIRSAKNKRKFESNQRDNRAQQPLFKRQNVGGSNVARSYTAGGNEGRIGHLTRDCKPAVPAAVNQRASMVNQRSATCFKCGRQRNFKKDCPKLKNQNHGNKPDIPEARGKAYAIGEGDANPRSNVVTGHPFNIDLMPVELGSFDVIIGMDWLSNNHAMIVYDEKIVRIPFGDKILIVRGDWSDEGKKSTLSIISYTKTQKYMEKGCQVFLTQVTKKETEIKSQEKRLKDVPIVWKFLEVFPEDFPRMPLVRQVKFQINLVPGAAPVARAPYRLAPSEMQELSVQLQELSDEGFIRPSSSP
ncbi:putative reverse transcriptase domain-containing protein, partial [Tanacetum coccineum]